MVADLTFLCPAVFAIPWLNLISIPIFLASITTKTSLSQQLLFPLEVELNVQQIEEFNQNKEILLALGFQMELNL